MGGKLIVGLKETDSSPVFPIDFAADFTCWYTGPTEAERSGSSSGNTDSSTHHSADQRIWLLPFLGQPSGYGLDEVASCFFGSFTLARPEPTAGRFKFGTGGDDSRGQVGS